MGEWCVGLSGSCSQGGEFIDTVCKFQADGAVATQANALFSSKFEVEKQ